MKRGFTKTIIHPEEKNHADDYIASHPPPKSRMIRRSHELVMKRGFTRTVVLPEKGVHADDGFLFHHVASYPYPSSEMIWRLREHDFIPEEDEIIRNNWKEFAEEYNIPLDQALKYAGMGDREEEFMSQEAIDRRYFSENANFWPRMCKDLECRCGYQIHRRMHIIFDDAVVSGKVSIQYRKRNSKILHLADLINYVEAYPKCKYIQYEAVKIVGSPLLKFQAGLGHFLNINGNVGRKHWKCLWNTVDRVVKVFPITRTFHRNYRKAIMRRDRSELADLTKSINFKRIGNIMLKSIKGCKEAWNELTVELLKEYIRSYDRVKIGAIAFEEACNKVFTERAFISPDRFSLFLRLLLKCIKDDAISKTKMKKKYFHMDRLAEMLLDYGISGIHIYDPSMSEVECIYSHAKIHLTECDTEILSKLNRNFTLKEKIQLFTTAYDMQFQQLGARNIFPIEEENEPKYYVITKDGFLCFKMDNYYKALEIFDQRESEQQ